MGDNFLVLVGRGRRIGTFTELKIPLLAQTRTETVERVLVY
jgi:hypothetical protein